LYPGQLMTRAHVDTAPLLLGARQVAFLCAGLLAAALLIFWIGRATNLDLMLADTMFDAGAKAFPWRHAWLTETFSHTILKSLLTLAAAWFIVAAAWDAWRPRPGRSALDRLRLRVVGLSSLVVLILLLILFV
jgi:membrane-associated PAP2 superfamily phosphatase